MPLKIKNSNKKKQPYREANVKPLIPKADTLPLCYTTSQRWLPFRPMTIKESVGTNILALHCFRTHWVYSCESLVETYVCNHHESAHSFWTQLYLQYSHHLIYHLVSNVWKALYTISASIFVYVPYWLPYSTDKFISCVVPGPSQRFFHFGEETVIAWTQEKTTTLGGTELHHSSWQCKELHRCCHGPLALLAIGDSGTFTVYTRYESMQLWYLRQSERTAAMDPVQCKRWTYSCYRAVNMEYQEKWTRWWCTMPSKHLAIGDK